jgi:hypothetical protein
VNAVVSKMECIELSACVEFRILQAKFSSGVTIHELQSVAEVLAGCTGLLPPGREAKRSFPVLVKWFVSSWARISPWLAVIELRDECGQVIDGQRESLEKKPAEFSPP